MSNLEWEKFDFLVDAVEKSFRNLINDNKSDSFLVVQDNWGNRDVVVFLQSEISVDVAIPAIQKAISEGATGWTVRIVPNEGSSWNSGNILLIRETELLSEKIDHLG
jgi:hypothetical protein